MFTIQQLLAREILDGRGRPTLEVDCLLESGILGRASVPGGPSTAGAAARAHQDGDARWAGDGVLGARNLVEGEIAQSLEGMDARDQAVVDRTLLQLDGTEAKSRLGANTTLAVSLAVARATAETTGLALYAYLGGPTATLLPVPMLDALESPADVAGPHAVQLVPLGFDRYGEALRAGAECWAAVEARLAARGADPAVGRGGGLHWAAEDPEESLGLVLGAVADAGYEPGEQVALAVTVDAGRLVTGANGHGVEYAWGDAEGLSAEDLLAHYQGWLERFPLVSLDDPVAESDRDGWRLITDALYDEIQLVGGELFATRMRPLAEGIGEGLANAVRIEPIQCGTLTETLEAVELAKINAYTFVVAHREGETEDTTIADLAVATRGGLIAGGGVGRGDRVVKYNRLLRIEETLEAAAVFAGPSAFPRFNL